jgi:hypothetical protein
MIGCASRFILEPFLVAQRHRGTMGSSEGSNLHSSCFAAHTSHSLTP